MIKLLIVDDSNIIRRKIERSVSVAGLTIIGTAANGVEAVKLFKKHTPDLVTMDLTMPEMDGLEAVTALLALKSDTRILVVSALADKTTAIEAIRRGARGFLCKPFTDKELNDALMELLEFDVR
ncbi:MAG: response regulator [Candidatus Competibacteraceae bacterium]|nr:response regulator [Candidatus Competibacteraceae bacterium]MBK7984996.1 response regulator [Candidatus Competibacteraceae bacterium]MBK8895923.1 response regulator [Candidatus Competibacteraceae bacterium]MBK8963014.1 response regulator [Candidatus Competibacteraceae bacterium]MBK9953051.1 response regulator [Candidatus Competibacteraceae bacterium]